MTPSGFDSNEYFASPGKRQLSDLARRINSDGYELIGNKKARLARRAKTKMKGWQV